MGNAAVKRADPPIKSAPEIDQCFINQIQQRLERTLREESDKDIEHWTGELKVTLNRMKDEDMITRLEKEQIWKESRLYSVGYVAQMVQEWKNKLRRKQEKNLDLKNQKLWNRTIYSTGTET